MRKSLWDGLDPHPIISELSVQLENLGFSLERGGKENDWYYHWSQQLFSDHYFFVEVFPNRAPKGSVDFSVDLGVSSVSYMNAENRLRTWECGTSLSLPEHFPFQHPLSMFRISLHWLLLNAEPPVRRLTWGMLTSASTKDCADLVVGDYLQYGVGIKEQVTTLSSLARFLQNIDTYPKKTAAPGPRSGEASLCAALCLFQVGEIGLALAELELGYRADVARIHRTFSQDPATVASAIEMRRCKIERYRSFFESQSNQSKSSG